MKDKITIQNGDIKVTIEAPTDTQAKYLLDTLINALRGFGYSDDLIQQYFNTEI